ncbi:MAG: prenyltransferase/squalene oxidase repeat-containing protein [Caulobacteraceae bacterium]
MGAGQVYDEAIDRGAEWIAGLQSKNGGFASFDADNTHGYLNNIPFADHGALLDPPTVDVAARCVSLLGQLGERAQTSPRMKAALDYLESEQEQDGSFWGRWGVNYIYGTWSAPMRLQRRRPHHRGPRGAQVRRLAGGHPEPGRRLGRELRQLRPSPTRAMSRAVRALPRPPGPCSA